MVKHKDRDEWVHLCRVERHITGDVTLRVLPDDSMVELNGGEEFMTILTRVDPFTPLDPAAQAGV